MWVGAVGGQVQRAPCGSVTSVLQGSDGGGRLGASVAVDGVDQEGGGRDALSGMQRRHLAAPAVPRRCQARRIQE